MANILTKLQNRLDAEALEQLREIAAKLYEELEETKKQRDMAEDAADFWRDQVFNIQEQLATDDRHSLGMTKTGEMMVVNKH